MNIWGYLYLSGADFEQKERKKRKRNPRLRTHHLLYECKTVLFYGVPIVQIFRHADEHDQLTSLRCLCCKVNVAKNNSVFFLTLFFSSSSSFYLCINEYSLLWVRGRKQNK